MLDCLPEQIEPIGLADAGRSFRGELPLDACSRLLPLLTDAEGQLLQVQLVFHLDERRIRVLEGSIDGCLHLVCQRCLETLEFPLKLGIRLGIVASEDDIDRLPDGYEPLLVDGEPLKTADVVEDEILLAIPPVPLHAHCDSGYRNQPEPEKDNPFSVLEKLKT
jgi:uncharacterized protein